MQQLKQKRVGIYVRVSTEIQSTEGYSIDGQINQIREYCDFNNFVVVDVYADRGISGKSMNRPELQRLLKDANEGQIDSVMVYKTNRLARNTSDLLKIVEDLHRQNVEFFSLSERMEVNTSSGKLMLQILASFQNLKEIILSKMYSWVTDALKKAIIKAICRWAMTKYRIASMNS